MLCTKQIAPAFKVRLVYASVHVARIYTQTLCDLFFFPVRLFRPVFVLFPFFISLSSVFQYSEFIRYVFKFDAYLNNESKREWVASGI